MDIVSICAILMPVLMVAVILYFHHKKERERSQLIEKMLDKGIDPAVMMSLLNGKKDKDNELNPTKHFKSGVSFSTVGLGFMAGGWLCDWSTVGIGAFIAIVGFGELAVAWYLRKYSK